jgi:hypothetical protein
MGGFILCHLRVTSTKTHIDSPSSKKAAVRVMSKTGGMNLGLVAASTIFLSLEISKAEHTGERLIKRSEAKRRPSNKL